MLRAAWRAAHPFGATAARAARHPEHDLNTPRTSPSMIAAWRTGRARAGRGGATRDGGASGAGTSIRTRCRCGRSRPHRAAAPVVDLRATLLAGAAGRGRRRAPGSAPSTTCGSVAGGDRRGGGDRDDQAVRPPPRRRPRPARRRCSPPSTPAGRSPSTAGGRRRRRRRRPRSSASTRWRSRRPIARGADLVDGHAVVIVGYGRHDAFPGGGYVIVRSGWGASGWGDGGDGYMPFTYLRAYATELCTIRGDGRWPGSWTGR